MHSLNILIIEDNVQEAGMINHLLTMQGYHVCGIAATRQQALQLLQDTRPDIAIIDIYLQGKPEGIGIAEAMNADEHTRRPFIFLTSAADRNTFEQALLTHPFSYLLKPFNTPELQYAIELAVEKFAREETGHFAAATEPLSVHSGDVFFVKKGHMLAKIQTGEIRYIEVDGKYCKLVYGQEKYIIQKSLVQLQEQLPVSQFVRIHRNYLVSMKEITRINLHDQCVELQDGHALTYSRRYLEHLMQVFPVLK